MEVRIKPNASEIYHKKIGERGLNDPSKNNFYNILKKIEGRSLPVYTDELFVDQFYVSLIPFVSKGFFIIKDEYVDKVIDDERFGEKFCLKCLNHTKDETFCEICGSQEIKLFEEINLNKNGIN